MKILGVQLLHNPSVSYFENENLIYYNQEERLSMVKGYKGIPFRCLEEIKKITDDIDVLLISTYNYGTSESVYLEKLLSYFGIKVKETHMYFKPHHLTHAVKAFVSSNFTDSLVVVWDGRGSTFNLSDGSVAYETTTAFEISQSEGIQLLHKKVYRNKCHNKLKINELKNLNINFSSEYIYNDSNIYGKFIKIHDDYVEEILAGGSYDIGHFYTKITKHCGFSPEDCGKLMGLHSYGKENKEISDLILSDYSFNDNLFDENSCVNIDKYPQLSQIPENKNMLFDFAYESQKAVEKVGLNFLKELLKKSKYNNLVLTGGVALNIVANSFYRKNLPQDINLYVEPLCGDEGNSIGICQLYSADKLKTDLNVPNTLYLGGNEPNYDFELMGGEKIIHDVNYSHVTDLLIYKNIVAIYQGKSEAGPRALGNRSILFDPRVVNGKEIVNIVKKREEFRPFACTVLFKEAHKWFDMSLIKESPYMMYSFDALPGVKDIIPSVIHVDNTCRIQTLKKEQNYHFYNLIENFYKKTKVPILFNTSFNLAGDAIVETIYDALNTLRMSQLEYLYLPEINKLIYIKNNEN